MAYREQGYPFPAIAKQMKISISTAHAYVVEGLNLIPLENAKQVLALELKRLDGLLAAHYPNAIEGDVAATNVSLNIIHRRSQLLGLYPEYGKMAAVLVSASPIGEPIQVEFVVPTGRREPADAPPAPGQPPFPWQKSLPAPEPEMFKDVLGVWRWGRTE